MAHYRHLPVWKAALGLAAHLEHAVRRFGKSPSPTRYHEYTLGSELRQTAQRPGLGPCTEWPLATLALLRQQLRASGIGHQVVSQTGHSKTGFKQRMFTAVWMPPKLIHSNSTFNL